MAERESHSHMVQGGRGHWWTDRLWVESADRRFARDPDPDWIVPAEAD